MRYQSGVVQFLCTDIAAGAAVNIGSITQLAVSTGTETLSDDSGELYDETRSIARQSPSAAWTTKALATALGTIGPAGYCISSDGSHPGVRLFCKALGDCKSPPAATDGLLYTFGKGLVVLNSLTARRGQDATVSCSLHAITDGTNSPITGAYASITFPTIALTSNQQFVLGVCKVANIVLADLDEVTINFGLSMTARTPMLGSVWSDSIAVRKIQPTITFRSYNPTVLDDTRIPLAGIQGSHANTLIQLKKRLNYASFVPNATAQHITFTANGIVTVPGAFSGSGNAEGSAMLQMNCIHDGTTVPIFGSNAAVYTASP